MTTPEGKENAPIVCDICGKSFSHEDRLVTHWCTRTGEYPCDICGKIFGHEDRLVTHWCIRADKYPYSCDTCGKSFSRDAYLRVHPCTPAMESAPHSCDTCGRSCCQKPRLLHSGKIQSRSDVRGRRSSRRSALVNPVVVRSDKGDYLCGLCGRNFRRAVYVLSHHRRFHRKKVERQENGAQGGGATAMADSSGLQLITSHLGGLRLFI